MIHFLLFLVILVGGCNAADDSLRGSGGGDGAGSTDTDTTFDDKDTDSCLEGQLFCRDNVVYRCGADADSHEPVEECAKGLACINGSCVTPDACGEAMARKSNIGCEYYAVDMANLPTGGNAQDQPYGLVISNLDSSEEAVVVVEARTGSSEWTEVTRASVPGKSVEVFKLTGEGVALSPKLDGVSGSGLFERQAYRVTSSIPVVAYQFNPYSGLKENLQGQDEDICSNDGTLLIPTSGMDRYYYALTFPGQQTDGYDDESGQFPSTINIVGTRENTTVTVRASATVIAGDNVEEIAGGDEKTFSLDAADVLQLESLGDLSGTYIEASAPIGVFAGHVCAFVPTTKQGFCDHLEHQMFPLTTWGQTFVAARSPVRSRGAVKEDDIWRVIASVDGTTLTSEPEIPGLPSTLAEGKVVQFKTNESFRLTASEPILVGQFIGGEQSLPDTPMIQNGGGDPAFALLAPIEQYMEEYVFLAPDKYVVDYVVIASPREATVRLDGEDVSGSGACSTDGLGASWNVTTCRIEDATHIIEATQPVGITVWGFGGRVSYGYTGGLDLQTINPVVVK